MHDGDTGYSTGIDSMLLIREIPLKVERPSGKDRSFRACKSFTLKTFFELLGFTQRQKQYLFSSYSWYVLYIHEKFLVILNETFKGFSEATLCKVYEQTGNVDVLAYVRQLGTHKITEMKQQVLHWLKCENTV